MKPIKLIERFTLKDLNAVSDGTKLTEAEQQSLDIKGVRAIFPLIQAMQTDVLSRNMTLYTESGMKGLIKRDDHPVGYESFVSPYGKPVLREHRNSDSWFAQAEKPLGRIVWSAWKKNKEKDGSLYGMGSGSLMLIPAITDAEAIQSVLAKEYYSVSIGSTAHAVIDSIWKKDLIKAAEQGEYSPYERGQEYDGQLCYWIIPQLTGEEVSYVNSPSFTKAYNLSPDLGEAQVRLMLSEKVIGENRLKFYDLSTKEEILLDSVEDFAIDTSFGMMDSYNPGKEFFVMSKNLDSIWLTESTDTTEDNASEDNLQIKLKELNHELGDKPFDTWTVEDLAIAYKLLAESSLENLLTEIIENEG